MVWPTPVRVRACGVCRLPHGPRVSTRTHFDLASLTKPHVAATLLTLVLERRLAVVDLVAAPLQPRVAGEEVGIERRLLQSVRYLASDELEGRGVGTAVEKDKGQAEHEAPPVDVRGLLP